MIPLLNRIFRKKEKELQALKSSSKNDTTAEEDDDELREEDLEDLAQKPEITHQKTGIIGLVLLPTRELALQVETILQKLLSTIPKTDPFHFKSCLLVGGLSSLKQERILSQQPDLLVSTIGRLWDMIEHHQIGLDSLPYSDFLILDEVDRIIDLGLYKELEKILNFLDDP